jgi:hypothetical protein
VNGLRGFLRGALRLGVRAGWVVIALATALSLFEVLGLWAFAARSWLAAELGRPRDEVRIDMLRLSWLRPRLEFEGLSIGPEGAAIRVERAVLDFDLVGADAPRLVRARVEGGGFEASRQLLAAWQSLEPVRDAQEGPSLADMELAPGLLPEIEISDLDIGLRSETLGRVRLGKLHLVFSADEDGRPVATGRLDPSAMVGGGQRGAALHLRGMRAKDGAFELRGTARELRLRAEELPEAQLFGPVREANPQVSLDLDLEARIPLAAGEEPSARLALQLFGGSLSLFEGEETLRELELRLQADWHPRTAQDWFSLDALDLQARYSGSTSLGAVRGGAVCGASAGDQQAALWLASDEFQIGGPLKDLLAQDAFALRQWHAYEPRGTARLRAAWRIPRPAAGAGATVDAAARARLDALLLMEGGTGLCFRGWPVAPLNAMVEGFPLDLHAVKGAIVVHHDRADARPLRVGVAGVECSSKHAQGDAPVQVRGDVRSHRADASPFAPGRGMGEFDLRIDTPGLPFDEATMAAMQGVSGAVDPATTWIPFAPRGGRIATRLRLARTVDFATTSVEADMRLEGIAARWVELPVPIAAASGSLRFLSDGLGSRGLDFDIAARTEAGNDLRVEGRLQTLREDGARAAPETDDLLLLRVGSSALALGGADVGVLRAAVPEVEDAFAELAPRGSVAFEWNRLREGRGAPELTRMSLAPRADLVVRAASFPIEARAIEGGALVVVDAAGRVATKAVPLVARAQADALAAVAVRLPERAVEVVAAGADAGDPELAACLRAIAGADALGRTVKISGRADARGSAVVGGAASFAVAARGASLAAGRLALDGLSGVVRLEDGRLSAEGLAARLGTATVDIRSFAWDPRGDGPLEARFSAADVPLDRRHLAMLLDEGDLSNLLDTLELAGAVSIEDARLRLAMGGADGLELSGTARPRKVGVRLGLPIRVDDARLVVERLHHGPDGLKALVRAEGLSGALADRAISDTRLVLTWVGDQLSIDEWDGRLEGGRLRGLGGEGRGAAVLGLSMRPPSPFQLAVRLEGVEVPGLLRGLFPARMGTRGKFDAELALSGELDRLLSIEGDGRVQVSDSRLWAVPVFRELLGQLGLDASVVFESLAANLRVEDGKLRCSDASLRAPLLQLSGGGALDFDGGLDFELGLTYGLVDRLGAVRQALYWLQNKILSVTISGEMAQPVVRIQNPLGSLLQEAPRRRLPLPPLSPMPPRF